MGVLTAYSLPIQGLKNGIHKYNYVLDGSFFKEFEASPINSCEIEVEVELDKRSDMMVFHAILTGWMDTTCDRCSAGIEMPMEGEHDLFVKYSEEKEEDDDEVVFISREMPSFNLAKYLYEFAVLSLPISNTYDCENDEIRPCDMDVLKYLEGLDTSKDNDTPDESIWDALKDIK